MKLKGASPADCAVVEAMCAVLKHRGPDGHRVAQSADGRACIGYRWLKAGCPEDEMVQPAAEAERGIILAFEGALTEEIGAQPNAAQKIAALYVEKGDDFIHDVKGEFGLALYDAGERRLALARDRTGTRALYYTVTAEAVWFASEAAALLECPGVERALDDEGVYHHFTFGACPAPYTLYKGIRKLRPAEMAAFAESGAKSARLYWNMLSAPLVEGSDEELAERTLELMRASTNDMSRYAQGGADVFLSGGLDSSAMLAALDARGKKIKTITLGFAGPDGKPMGEMAQARLVAGKLGSEHYEVILDREGLINRFKRLHVNMDDPYTASEATLLDAIAEKAAECGAAVALYGEAGDVDFSGAGAIGDARALEAEEARLRAKPRFLLRAAAYRRNRVPGLFGHYRSIDRRGEMCSRASRRQRLYWGSGIQMGEDFKRLLLAGDFLKRVQGISSYDIVAQFYREMDKARPRATMLQKMNYLDYKVWTVEHWARAAIFPHGIDARLPFLDRRMVEFAMALPERAVVGDGRGKYLLKRAMENILPDEIINRKKVGFTSPVIDWLSGVLADMLEEEMRRSSELAGTLLNFNVLRRLIRAHRARKADNKWVLLQLVTFFSWYRHWIARRPV